MNLKIGDLIIITSRSLVVLNKIDNQIGYLILDIKHSGHRDAYIYTLIGDKKIIDFKIWNTSSCQIKKIND